MVLLVRYRNANAGTYLVGPGGELKEDENVVQAVVRETMEETNVRVQPKRVVIIEDLVCTSFKMIKVWMVCEVVEGNISKTHGAEKEAIIEAAWYTRLNLLARLHFHHHSFSTIGINCGHRTGKLNACLRERRISKKSNT